MNFRSPHCAPRRHRPGTRPARYALRVAKEINSVGGRRLEVVKVL